MLTVCTGYFRKTAESNNERVQTWSIIECLVVCLVGFLQVSEFAEAESEACPRINAKLIFITTDHRNSTNVQGLWALRWCLAKFPTPYQYHQGRNCPSVFTSVYTSLIGVCGLFGIDELFSAIGAVGVWFPPCEEVCSSSCVEVYGNDLSSVLRRLKVRMNSKL